DRTATRRSSQESCRLPTYSRPSAWVYLTAVRRIGDALKTPIGSRSLGSCSKPGKSKRSRTSPDGDCAGSHDVPTQRQTSAMSLRVLQPMLATTRPPTEPAEWVFEPKLDGWR